MKKNAKGKKGVGKTKKKEPIHGLKTIGVWVWAQCDNAGCQKWRKLPPGTVINDNEPWFCYMNPNEDMNDCSIPEEEYNELTEAAVYSHPPSKHQSSDEDFDYEDQAAWGSKKKPAKRRKSSTDLCAKVELQTEQSTGSGGVNARETRPRTANKQMQMYDEAISSSQDEGLDQDPQGLEESKALQNSRGIVKARRTHTGLRKLLARGGVWEIVKGKGRAVTAPPAWVWEGLASHAPDSAELACKAADASSAARYFEIAQAPQGAQQASRAADNARLSLTTAAALAVQETSRIPGIDDSPVSASSDTPASGIFPGDILGEEGVQSLDDAAAGPGCSWQASEARLAAEQSIPATSNAAPVISIPPGEPSAHQPLEQAAEQQPLERKPSVQQPAAARPVQQDAGGTQDAEETESSVDPPGVLGHVGTPSADLSLSHGLEQSQSIDAPA